MVQAPASCSRILYANDPKDTHMKVALSPAVLLAALVIGLPSPAPAHEEVVGKIRIGHPWVRVAAAGDAGTYGCIIEIVNDGDVAERLLGATLDGAGPGTLYEIVEMDGKFTSRKVAGGLAIEPHGSLELTPSTYQIRFGKVTKALEAGEMVDGTLVFEKLHSVPVSYMVELDDTAPKEEGSPPNM
jgi:copper(I)-binding protein